MELPDALVSEVRAGNVVLFLGAGASVGAESADGRKPLSGLGLRDALSRRFLGGNFAEDDLMWVSELAIAETNLGTVQDFVAELFADLNPADFHMLLPSFKWRGLATTNYDRLVERTYEVSERRAQQLVPFISNFTIDVVASGEVQTVCKVGSRSSLAAHRRSSEGTTDNRTER